MVKPYNIGSSAIYENSNTNTILIKSGKNKIIPTKNAPILRTTIKQNEMANDTNATATTVTATGT